MKKKLQQLAKLYPQTALQSDQAGFHVSVIEVKPTDSGATPFTMKWRPITGTYDDPEQAVDAALEVKQ